MFGVIFSAVSTLRTPLHSTCKCRCGGHTLYPITYRAVNSCFFDKLCLYVCVCQRVLCVNVEKYQSIHVHSAPSACVCERENVCIYISDSAFQAALPPWEKKKQRALFVCLSLQGGMHFTSLLLASHWIPAGGRHVSCQCHKRRGNVPHHIEK